MMSRLSYFIFKKILVIGDGEIAWWLRALAILQKSRVWFPVPTSGESRQPIVPARDLTLPLLALAGTCTHMA